MRILCLTQWFSPEPESSRGLPLAKWLQNRGHEVTVLTGFPNYPTGRLYDGYRLRPWQWDVVEGVRLLRVPLYPSHDQSATRRSLNYLSFAASAALVGLPKTGDVDVVYAMATPPTIGVPPLIGRLLRGTPYLFNVTDIWPDAVADSGMVGRPRLLRTVNWLLDRLCRVVYGGAASVTAISEGYKHILVERGLSEERVHAVYNWVDEDLMKPVARDQALAAKLGLAGRFNFIYAGNLGPLQGVETVIRAAAHVQHEPEIQIVIVGTGQLDAELRALARSLGLGNVTFTGRFEQREMPSLYAAADVLLIHLNDRPFLRATVPSKTQVSMAVARPTLIAACGEAAEIIERAGGGVVCPPQDEHALARAMLQMYRLSREEREAMGNRARRYYAERMSLDVGARRIEDLLAEAIANPGRRAAQRSPTRPQRPEEEVSNEHGT
jgi:colanic acid biosynthesis glycosyl transferase WcaI